MKGIDLGNRRLDKRAIALLDTLSARPTASIPAACSRWSETIAAYRFFDNDVTWEGILAPIWSCSRARIAVHHVVLMLQATTELDFNGQGITDLGPLSHEAQRGLYVHPTYAASADREPLRLLDAWMWAREPQDADARGSKRARGRISFTLPARQGQKTRLLRQQLWARLVDLPHGNNQTIRATCVVAKEIDPLAGSSPVEWRLLTNRTAETLDEVPELIDWYRARWEIEIFFHILKNGCRIEALQLGAIEGLQRAIALYLMVSWRIAVLMRFGRTCPDLPADLFFHEDEWHAAYLLNKKKPPADLPTLNQVLRLVAMLGGFLARESDGEPGVKTMWLGLQRVMDCAVGPTFVREAA